MLKLISHFWKKSIRRQLMLGIILVHAVLMTLFVSDLVNRQKDFLNQQSVSHALGLAKTLATNSTPWVLSNDIAGLEEIIHSQSSFPNLQYAMIVSPDGRVISHTDSQHIGLYLNDKVSQEMLTQTSQHVTIQTANTIDVASPVVSNNKIIGWARVNINQGNIIKGLDIITLNGSIYTLIAIVIGTIFAYFMAKGMTRSLQHLVGVADQVRSGERSVRSNIDRNDEIGHLSNDFNSMLETILKSEQDALTTREKLAESEERFNLAMQGSNDGLWDWNIKTNRVYFSPRWKQMLGYKDDEIKSDVSEWERLIHPDDLEKAEHAIQEHIEGKTNFYENVQRVKHSDGTYRWHLERGVAVRDKNNQAYRMVGVTTDLTDRKNAENALFDEKEKALVTLHSIGDAVITTDKNSLIEFMNPVAEDLTGWQLNDASGKHIEEVMRIINEQTGAPLDNPVTRCLKEETVIELSNNSALIAKNGEQIAIQDSAAPIRDRDGVIIGTVMVFHDVGVTRELSKRMAWQATHDSLTGLINRSEFEIRLTQLIHNAKIDNTEHVILYLDLDQFKIVNDTCGHSAGDELLKQISFLLQDETRESDTLARLGGDEFGVLLDTCSIEKAELIADKLRQIVNDFQFVWHDKSFDVGVSIGITNINNESESLSQILSESDIACYAAKDLGRNRIHVYTADDQELSRRHSEMQWVSRITKALEENRFILYSQKIEPVSDGSSPVHREILIRMLSESGELILPYSFIPAAERFNIMPSIDKWVISNSFKYLSESEDQNEKISINLSGNTLGDETILDYIRDNLRLYEINPRRICFEITETTAISHLSRAVVLMRELKLDGCQFSLDDFGSGLSSFSYLKNLPVDYLKIDGSFVKDIVDDPIDRAIVNAINQVGQIMGLKTIAEFVENDEILSTLKLINIDYAQGYGIEKPMPLSV